jgi:hypothetical protein
MNEQEFDRLWRESTAGTFSPTEEKEELCSYAQHFAVFAEGLVLEEARGPTQIGVNQKMLLVTKKYFEWRAVVPIGHRDRISKRSHTCIFHVFERTFMQLKALELSLTPPMLFLPPPPAPPPPPVEPQQPQVKVITLGEVLGEE